MTDDDRMEVEVVDYVSAMALAHANTRQFLVDTAGMTVEELAEFVRKSRPSPETIAMLAFLIAYCHDASMNNLAAKIKTSGGKRAYEE